MLKPALIACASLLFAAAAAHAAGDTDALGMLYEMKLAPTVCKWTPAANTAKLDTNIKAAEQALSVSDADKAKLMAAAEADIKSDPSNCEPDGMLAGMYKASLD
jgi:hypothetical protein